MDQCGGVGGKELVGAGAGLFGGGVWASVAGVPVSEGVGAPLWPGVGVSVGDGGEEGIVVGVVEAGADLVAVSGAGWGLALVGLLVTGVGFAGMLAVAGGRTRR
jgi:hypothetical protein